MPAKAGKMHSDMVSQVQGECVLSETILHGLCDFSYSVPHIAEPSAVDESFIRCHGWLGHLGDCEWRTEADHRLHRERNHDGAVFSSSGVDVGEKIGSGWKKILWQSGKIAFIFSVSIEMLQLLLRLGTFQLSDIFYNTVGGIIGGLMYCAVMKVRKRL